MVLNNDVSPFYFQSYVSKCVHNEGHQCEYSPCPDLISIDAPQGTGQS